MTIHPEKMTAFHPDRPLVDELIHDAFVKEERLPPWMLNFLSTRKNSEFLGFYDEENNFVGFTFTSRKGNYVFLLYLAVLEEVRGCGYGSQILQILKNRYKGCIITVNIELLDKKSENYDQRLQRLFFYEKNGFYNTYMMLLEKRMTYLILSSDLDFDIASYKKVLKYLSYGFMKIQIEPFEAEDEEEDYLIGD